MPMEWINEWMNELKGREERQLLQKKKIHSAQNTIQMLHKVYDIYMQVITYPAFKLPRTECTLSKLRKISKGKQCIQIMFIYWIFFKKNWRDVMNTLELDAAHNLTSLSQNINVSPIYNVNTHVINVTRIKLI
jgi:hypothetical protein